MDILDNTNEETGKLQQIIKQFYPFAKEYLDFGDDPNVVLRSDGENAGNFLGKTAYYAPDTYEIHLFIDKRHPKDVLRSLSHELVHHSQNCRGEFDKKHENVPQMGETGYAQGNPHLRNMEKEAYLVGNLLFRDWCDGLSSQYSAILLENEDKMNQEPNKTEKKVLKSEPKTHPRDPKKPLKQWYFGSLYDKLAKKWTK
tara:strand:- start:3392 stop:3988 length:597 start_codon:yes stop_codon:yes gene_type:complete